MAKKLISQIDKRWSMYSRYETRATDSLADLDNELFMLLEKPTANRRKNALRALADFTQQVEKLIKRGEVLHGRGTYHINNYGCWDCCMCMVAADFNVLFYPYEKRQGLLPTPPHFLTVMRSWQMLSVVGYCDDIVTDAMTVITRGRVQLFMHEDYGINGVGFSDSILLRYALQHHRDLTIVACVKDHPLFGSKPATHWIVIDPAGTELSDGLNMRDPAILEIKQLSYRRLYTLCLYTSAEHTSTLLAQRIN